MLFLATHCSPLACSTHLRGPRQNDRVPFPHVPSALPVLLCLQHTVTEQCRFFTAGVFLGVGLLHMLPEAVEGFEDLLSTSGPNALFPSPPSSFSPSNLTELTSSTEHLPLEIGGIPWGNFPMAYAICCLGFVLVWFVEKRIVSGPEGALLAADPPGLLPQGQGRATGRGSMGARGPMLGSDLDQRRMVAMAAGAESQGGASLCVVHVSCRQGASL